ncbi:MAG: SusC/RagA family TonB-linked outer membrane protein [Prevotella sp.]|jgi:TonB-linked SusC/RagA family outer membrane protein|nr:SusC/RagA family TonB-linked outer membrane protein [Prevotella sp.]
MNNKYSNHIKKLLLLAFLLATTATAQENEDKPVFSRPDGGVTAEEELVAAESKIDGASLTRYPDVLLSNSLQGKAAGLIVRMTNNGLGNNEANIFIRGQATNQTATAIVVIDGIERPFNDLLSEEIESIEVLKDAAAKILYGPAAANGVLVVKTKRGVADKRTLRLNAEMGVMQATRTPQYLNSYKYASLYNEALEHDGLPARYMPYQLEGYRNSSGANDVLYPNVDWYNYFTDDKAIYRRATFEASGGHKALRYSLVAGYLGGGGYENVGKSTNLDRLNVRGNLDIQVTDYLSVVADAAGRLETRNFAAINNGNFYTALSTNRPNEYPLTIPAENLGLAPNEDGTPYFGTSLRTGSNLYADMLYRGHTEERYVTSQTNVGLDFDFNKYVKGLTASGFITFDNYTNVTSSLREDFATYFVNTYQDAQGQEQALYTLNTKLAPNDVLTAGSDVTRRTVGWRANVGYKTSFGDRNLSVIAAYRYYKNEAKGATQDAINCNYTLRVNYDYAKKYLLELNAAYMGANQFADGNKFFFSPAIAGGWILSNEDFLSESESVNFLKIKASYGVLGYSGNTDYLLYNTRWGDGGTINLQEGNTGSARYINLVRVGNPDLKWEKSAEFNVGAEGSFFGNKLKAEINYFHEKRTDIIGTQTSAYAAYIGSYTMPTNIGAVENQGFDGSLSYGDKAGEFEYRAGVNFTASKNKLLEWDEIIQEADRQRVGKSTDAIFGLQALGLFGKDVDIATAPLQSFGSYGAGDLAYADRTGDGRVDVRDEIEIGHTFPRLSFGVDFNIKYRNWELYLLGTSELGVNKMQNTSYHWNAGENAYSALAEKRWHPVNNPTGTYPALTTTSGANSYRSSDFWLGNASFFRLKNIELSYNFDMQNVKWISSLRLFARGTNVFVLSSITDLDPEVLNAGITNNPLTSFYTGGVSFTF